MTRIFLASRSPRRAELLRQAGFDLVVSPVDDEESWLAGEAPVECARRLATAKFDAALRRIPSAQGTHAAGCRPPAGLLLAADTLVWISETGPPLGKPRDRDHARELLQCLCRAGCHFVTTAFVLGPLPTGRLDPYLGHETTRVFLRRADDREIEAILEAGDFADKAGAYAIQGRAAGLVTRLEGSYTNVVGLPLAQVLDRIHRAFSWSMEEPVHA